MLIQVMLMRVLRNIPLLLRLLLERNPLAIRETHVGNSHTITVDSSVNIFNFSTVLSTHFD